MKKACKKCRMIFSGERCPICNNVDFSETWKGRVIIVKPEESEIAKNLNLGKEGIYAIKIK